MSDIWRGLGFFVVIILLPISLSQLWDNIKLRKERAKSLKWTATTARVTKKEVRRRRGRDVDTNPQLFYDGTYVYSYSVQGEKFAGEKLLAVELNEEAAHDALDKIGIGDTIGLRYNPDNPKEHIRDDEIIEAGSYFSITVGLIIATAVIIGIVTIK